MKAAAPVGYVSDNGALLLNTIAVSLPSRELDMDLHSVWTQVDNGKLVKRTQPQTYSPNFPAGAWICPREYAQGR